MFGHHHQKHTPNYFKLQFIIYAFSFCFQTSPPNHNLRSRHNGFRTHNVWLPAVRYMYPQALTRTYCVPPVHFNRVPLQAALVAKQHALVHRYGDVAPSLDYDAVCTLLWRCLIKCLNTVSCIKFSLCIGRSLHRLMRFFLFWALASDLWVHVIVTLKLWSCKLWLEVCVARNKIKYSWYYTKNVDITNI